MRYRSHTGFASNHRIVLQELDQGLESRLGIASRVDDAMGEVFFYIGRRHFSIDWVVCRTVGTTRQVTPF